MLDETALQDAARLMPPAGLADLLRSPVVVAPMAGGPSTADLVIAAARGLVNQFIRDHAGAPAAYPEINNATRPLRAAAAARGDTEQMSLFAGQGYRSAGERAAGEIIERLCAEPP